jgi:hypothetical protein
MNDTASCDFVLSWNSYHGPSEAYQRTKVHIFYPCVLHPVAYEVQIHINIRKRNSVFYYSITSTLHHFIFLSRRVSAPRAIIR